jgi:hypothetical protein
VPGYLSLKQYHRVQVLLILTTLVVGLMTGIAIGNSEVINCELTASKYCTQIEQLNLRRSF